MLVGSGNPNNSEVLTFNGPQINVGDPFPKTGAASDRSWAFPTFSNLSMAGVQTAPGFGEFAQTVLTQSGGFDCKSWSAIIFSVPVLDGDRDGLADAIEASSTVPAVGGAWKNPDGEPVPDIHAMGAQTGRRDIFAEINAMRTEGPTTYGSTGGPLSPDYAPYDSAADPVLENVTVPLHDHTPGPDALKMAGDVFAPQPQNIAVHFDVGDTKAYLESASRGDHSRTALTTQVRYRIRSRGVGRIQSASTSFRQIAVRPAVGLSWRGAAKRLSSRRSVRLIPAAPRAASFRITPARSVGSSVWKNIEIRQ